MKLFLRIFVPVLLMAVTVFAQQNLDKVWVQGTSISYSTTFTSTGPVNQFWNSSPSNIVFWSGHSDICDGNGNLLIVTTGGDIYGANKNIIEDGDTILPKLMYYNFEGAAPNPQNSIILPFEDSIYYVFNSGMSDSISHHFYDLGDTCECFDRLMYHVVNMGLNGGAGKVVKRMRHALIDTHITNSRMTACRHGNGKDWWLIQPGKEANTVYEFLVKKDTVLGPYSQSFSSFVTMDDSWLGQAVFNGKGDRYAVTTDNNDKIFMANFDRCTGIFSAPKVYNVPDQFEDTTTAIDSTITGIAFSPNDSFLYVATWFNIQQLELNNLDSASAWIKIAGMDTTFSLFQGYGVMYLGHDHKLYLGNLETQHEHMSLIDKPDLKGLSCQFCPKCLHFPGGGVAIPPNMPNYKLGARTPSCDSAQFVASVPQAGILRIFPNPADASIIIEYETEGRFELTDMLGRVLLQAELVKGQNSLTIKTDYVPAGVYTYKYTSEKGGQITGKLVISH